MNYRNRQFLTTIAYILAGGIIGFILTFILTPITQMLPTATALWIGIDCTLLGITISLTIMLFRMNNREE